MVMHTCAVQRAVPPPHTPAAGPQRGAHTAALARADSSITSIQPQLQAWNSLLPTIEHFQPSGQSTGEPWRLRSSASENTEPNLLTACAWKVLLRGAENPTEFSRTDRRQRSRARYAQHKAAQPPCAAEEMYLHRKAMYKHRKGKSMDAIKLLKEGMSMYPSNCFFATSIGSIYSKKRQYQQAENYLQQALEVNPNSSVVLNALAGVKAKRGHADQARELFQQAVNVRTTLSISPLSYGQYWNSVHGVLCRQTLRMLRPCKPGLCLRRNSGIQRKLSRFWKAAWRRTHIMNRQCMHWR